MAKQLIGTSILGVLLILGFIGILTSAQITVSTTITSNQTNATPPTTTVIPIGQTSVPGLNTATTHYNSLAQASSACAVCSKNIMTSSSAYGNIQGAAAGSSIYFPYRVNSILYIYNVTVTKAQPEACIYTNLETVPFCSNSSTPERINVPVINGHFGETKLTYYPLNITFISSLGQGNQATFNFSVIDQNGTVLTPLTTSQANSIDVQENFKIPISDRVEITFDTSGNSNYSKIIDDPVTFPSKIIDAVGITFTNPNPVAIIANTPISFVFNALNYQQYETNTLNNTELFWANGTLITSWLEGNFLSEVQPAKNNYQSNTILFWFDGPNGFLPASSTNIIYLGFAGNTPTSANMLWGATAGVAPQLTCSTPSQAATCSSGNGVPGVYGDFDTGNQVFSFYNNFAGTSLSATLNTINNGGTATVDNGLTVSANGASAFIHIDTLNQYSVNEIDAFFTILHSSAKARISLDYALPTATGGDIGYQTGIQSFVRGSRVVAFQTDEGGSAKSTVNGGSVPSTTVTNSVYSLFYANTLTTVTNFNITFNYTEYVNGNNQDIAIGPFYLGITASNDGGAGSTAYWMRGRLAPPNSIMPSASFGEVGGNVIIGSPFATTAYQPFNVIFPLSLTNNYSLGCTACKNLLGPLIGIAPIVTSGNQISCPACLNSIVSPPLNGIQINIGSAFSASNNFISNNGNISIFNPNSISNRYPLYVGNAPSTPGADTTNITEEVIGNHSTPFHTGAAPFCFSSNFQIPGTLSICNQISGAIDSQNGAGAALSVQQFDSANCLTGSLCGSQPQSLGDEGIDIGLNVSGSITAGQTFDPGGTFGITPSGSQGIRQDIFDHRSYAYTGASSPGISTGTIGFYDEIRNAMTFNSPSPKNTVYTEIGVLNNFSYNHITVGSSSNIVTFTTYGDQFFTTGGAKINKVNLTAYAFDCASGGQVFNTSWCIYDNNSKFNNWLGFGNTIISGNLILNNTANLYAYNNIFANSIVGIGSVNTITMNKFVGLLAGTGLTYTSSNTFSLIPLNGISPIVVAGTNAIECPTCITTSSQYVPSISGLNQIIVSATNVISISNTPTFTTVTSNIIGNNAVFSATVTATTFDGNVIGNNAVWSGTDTATTFLGNVIGNNAIFSNSVTANTFIGNVIGNNAIFSASVTAPTFNGNVIGNNAVFSSTATATTFLGNVIGQNAVVSNFIVTNEIQFGNTTTNRFQFSNSVSYKNTNSTMWIIYAASNTATSTMQVCEKVHAIPFVCNAANTVISTNTPTVLVKNAITTIMVPYGLSMNIIYTNYQFNTIQT